MALQSVTAKVAWQQGAVSNEARRPASPSADIVCLSFCAHRMESWLRRGAASFMVKTDAFDCCTSVG
eukprot:scaffold92543_cov35-Tisochrysis_lutea.AAC.1